MKAAFPITLGMVAGSKISAFFPAIVAISLVVCFVPQSRADFFDGTGADIFNNPDFSFPTRPASLNGTILEFDPGAVVDLDNEVLFRYPLFPAGTFAQADPLSISVTMELVRRTFDFDPAIAISDGTSVVAFLAGNDNGGQAFSLTATDAGTIMPNQAIQNTLFANAGYPNIGGTLTVTADFTLEALQTSLSGSFGGGLGADVLPALD